MDEGTIHTTPLQDHIDATARVLKQLARNNVTVKLRKCQWATDEAKLIGHVVKCGEGFTVDPGKFEDMRAIKRLNTIGELKSFNGYTVYMHRFRCTRPPANGSYV